MPLVTQSRFRRLLRRLDRSAFERFAADCWRARGFETTIDEGILTVVNDRGSRQLLLWHGDAHATSATSAGLDAIVTNRPAFSPDELPRVLDCDDLRDLLLYAIDREVADDLFERYFDRPIETEPTPGPLAPLARAVSIGGATPVRWTVLAVVALVLVAGVVVSFGGPGLSGPLTSGTSTVATETPTLPYWIDQDIRHTPWPVPFGQGELADPPPWTAANRSVDVSAVIAASSWTLQGRSYRFTLLRSEAVHGQPLMTVRRTVAVERPGVYLVRYERDNDTTGELELAQSVYVNETGRFVWTPHGGATTATPPLEQVTTDGPQDDELTISSLYWLLAAPNPRVVRIVDRNETRLYRVDLSTDSNAEVERIDGYALVDRSGLVHTVRKSYEMSSGVEIELEVRYMDVGSTNVDPPAWLANVTANASSLG